MSGPIRGNYVLSPHLQIYRLPLTALLSITHRATGVFMAMGSVLLAAWLLVLASGNAECYAMMQKCVTSVFGKIVLIGWTYALFLHMGNGVRHLFWDAGKAFSMKAVDRGAYLVLAMSVILTAAVWILAHCHNITALMGQ